MEPVARPLPAFCALAAMLLMATASGGEPAAGTSSGRQIDACSLLLPGEISRVIGLPVNAGARKDAGLEPSTAYSSTCLWKIKLQHPPPADPTAPLGGQSFVILHAMQWPAGSGLARTFLEDFRKAAAVGDIPKQPVPRKFGDEALWWGDGLAVRKGDVSFGLSVFSPALKPKSAGYFEEQLAPAILRRLTLREPPRQSAP
jgi:hypothetical protein